MERYVLLRGKVIGKWYDFDKKAHYHIIAAVKENENDIKEYDISINIGSVFENSDEFYSSNLQVYYDNNYTYNNKILKVIPDNEGDFINGALLNEVKTNSKGEKISSSRTFGLQKAVENINIKDPIGKLKNFQQFIKGPKTDNLATMVVKVKEGSLWHTTDIRDVIDKEKTLLNEIKLYKSNKNRGR